MSLESATKTFTTGDNDAVSQLYILLSDYERALAAGLDQLDEFIKANFSLEDVIAVTR